MIRLGAPVRARTVASSANLGPGFDALGLALGLLDEVEVIAEPLHSGPSATVMVQGEGAGLVPTGEDHLVVASLRAGLARAAERAGVARPDVAVHLQCRNAIPHGRGLGSSAAAIAIGLILARGLLTEPHLLDDETVFDLANAAEGHPDNASAALFGGCTVSWTEHHEHHEHPLGPRGSGGPRCPGHARMVQLELHPDVRAVVCVPEAELATSKARAMLPERVPHADAAFTAGRAALLVEALTRRPDLLFAATQERLHQAQRAPAMPATAALMSAVRSLGAAAVVSGAGPSLLVLGMGEEPLKTVHRALQEIEAVAHPSGGAVNPSWRIMDVPIDGEGTRLVTR